MVAQATAGVPEVVADGRTGLLTPAGDVAAFAAAIGQMLSDPALAERMGIAAQAAVIADHSLAGATTRLQAILHDAGLPA